MFKQRASAAIALGLFIGLLECVVSPHISGKLQSPLVTSNQPVSFEGMQARKSLELGVPFEADLEPGQRQDVVLLIAPGQCAYFTVEPQELDVSVGVLDPEGHERMEITSPYGTQGPISVSLLGVSGGSHTGEVISTRNNAHSGRYTITLRALRPSTKDDLVRVHTQKLENEAEELLEKRTTEGQKLAAQRYAQAEALLKLSKGRLMEAQVLEKWANVLNALGETGRGGEGKALLAWHGASCTQEHRALSLVCVGLTTWPRQS